VFQYAPVHLLENLIIRSLVKNNNPQNLFNTRAVSSISLKVSKDYSSGDALGALTYAPLTKYHTQKALTYSSAFSSLAFEEDFIFS